MFVILWEFEVKPGCEEGFENAYSPDGDWARLFQRDRRYRMTRLFRDYERPNVYLTLDCWESEAAYEAFQLAHRESYAALDRATEPLTLRETRLGAWTQPG